jgi:hypothetical protein
MAAAASAVAALPQSRLRLELDCLLAYGAAAPSLLLLHRLGLLARLLPQHASLASRGAGLEGSPLLAVLRELDARASPAQRAAPEVVAALLVAPLVHARLQARQAHALHPETQQHVQQHGQQPGQQHGQQHGQQPGQQHGQPHGGQPVQPRQAVQPHGPQPPTHVQAPPLASWRRLQGVLFPALHRDHPEPAANVGLRRTLHVSPPALGSRAAPAAAGEGPEYMRLHGVIWDVAEEVG